MNLSDKDITIKTGQLIGSATEAEEVSEDQKFDRRVSEYVPLDLKSLERNRLARQEASRKYQYQTKTFSSKPVIKDSQKLNVGLSTYDILMHSIASKIKKMNLARIADQNNRDRMAEVILKNSDADMRDKNSLASSYLKYKYICIFKSA